MRYLDLFSGLSAVTVAWRALGWQCVAFAEVDPYACALYTREGNIFRISNVALSSYGVRRLTPRECERLQGFPDDYTLITYRRNPAKDGPRYRALGNSMAVPVLRWIGRQIERAHAS